MALPEEDLLRALGDAPRPPSRSPSPLNDCLFACSLCDADLRCPPDRSVLAEHLRETHEGLLTVEEYFAR